MNGPAPSRRIRVERVEPWSSIDFSSDELSPEPGWPGERWHSAGVGVLRRTRTGYRVEVGGFVGYLPISADLALQVMEPWPGFVRGLASSLAPNRRLDRRQHGGALPTSFDLDEAAQDFARDLADYVGQGVAVAYIPERQTMATPSGRVLPRQTVLNLARARPTPFVVVARRLRPEPMINGLLAEASYVAEYVCRVEGRLEHAGMIASARPVVECRYDRADVLTWAASPGFPHNLARQVNTDIASHERLLETAGFFVVGGAVSVDKPSGSPGLAGAWVKLTDLFEDAVLSEVERVAPSGSTVSRGEDLDIPLLKLARTGYRQADPDVVLAGKEGEPPVILDAKSSPHVGDPERGELNQLIAHSQATNASAAAIVAPRRGDRGTSVELGSDTRGCRYFQVTADPVAAGALRAALMRLLRSLQDPARSTQD